MCVLARVGEWQAEVTPAELWVGSNDTCFLVYYLKLIFIKALTGVLKIKGQFSFGYLTLSWPLPLPLKGQGKVILEVLCIIAGITDLLVCLVGIFPLDCCYYCVSSKHWNYGENLKSWEHCQTKKRKWTVDTASNMDVSSNNSSEWKMHLKKSIYSLILFI